MEKALTICFILLLAAGMILTGCGSGANGGGGGSKDGEAATITFWTFNELHVEFYEQMAEYWNEANPDQAILIDASVFPYEEHHNKLLISLQSGTGAPDIADVEISNFANFLKGTPQLVELNDIVDPVLNNIVESRVDIYAKDGTYYGLPFHVGAMVAYYNTEIMDQAGVNPTEIRTWDDFREAGYTVLEKTGVPITTFETGDQWSFWPFIVQQGGDYLDEDGKVALDSEINIRTLEFLQAMINDGTAIAAPGGGHHAEEYYGFMNQGGAASVFMPMWYMGRFTDYMVDLDGKIAIMPMPSWEEGGNRSSGMGGTGTVITNQASETELAKEFLAYAKLSEEGNIKTWEIMGFDPVRTDVWDDPALREENKFTRYFGADIFDTLIEVEGEIPGPNIGELTPDVSDAVKTKLMFRVINDGDDPASTVRELADELRSMNE